MPVDQLWPRGISREAANIDLWCRAIARSAALRKWYGHDPERFADFATRYAIGYKPQNGPQPLRPLTGIARAGTLTLLTATKAVELSQAIMLARIIPRHL